MAARAPSPLKDPSFSTPDAVAQTLVNSLMNALRFLGRVSRRTVNATVQGYRTFNNVRRQARSLRRAGKNLGQGLVQAQSQQRQRQSPDHDSRSPQQSQEQGQERNATPSPVISKTIANDGRRHWFRRSVVGISKLIYKGYKGVVATGKYVGSYIRAGYQLAKEDAERRVDAATGVRQPQSSQRTARERGASLPQPGQQADRGTGVTGWRSGGQGRGRYPHAARQDTPLTHTIHNGPRVPDATRGFQNQLDRDAAAFLRTDGGRRAAAEFANSIVSGEANQFRLVWNAQSKTVDTAPGVVQDLTATRKRERYADAVHNMADHRMPDDLRAANSRNRPGVTGHERAASHGAGVAYKQAVLARAAQMHSLELNRGSGSSSLDSYAERTRNTALEAYNDPAVASARTHATHSSHTFSI